MARGGLIGAYPHHEGPRRHMAAMCGGLRGIRERHADNEQRQAETYTKAVSPPEGGGRRRGGNVAEERVILFISRRPPTSRTQTRAEPLLTAVVFTRWRGRGARSSTGRARHRRGWGPRASIPRAAHMENACMSQYYSEMTRFFSGSIPSHRPTDQPACIFSPHTCSYVGCFTVCLY